MLSISKHRQNLVKISSFILKIFGGNKIPMLFMGCNSVMNEQKLMLNNLKLYVVIIYALQNVVKIHSFVLSILSGNEILISFKGHNSVIN